MIDRTGDAGPSWGQMIRRLRLYSVSPLLARVYGWFIPKLTMRGGTSYHGPCGTFWPALPTDPPDICSNCGSPRWKHRGNSGGSIEWPPPESLNEADRQAAKWCADEDRCYESDKRPGCPVHADEDRPDFDPKQRLWWHLHHTDRTRWQEVEAELERLRAKYDGIKAAYDSDAKEVLHWAKRLDISTNPGTIGSIVARMGMELEVYVDRRRRGR